MCAITPLVVMPCVVCVLQVLQYEKAKLQEQLNEQRKKTAELREQVRQQRYHFQDNARYAPVNIM